MAKASRPKQPKAPTTLSDIVLTVGAGQATVTISPNAQWAGIQKFVNMSTNDGAVSVGDWYFSTAPGPDTTKTVKLTGTGYYRGWSSDFDYTVHVSNVVFVP